MALAKGRQKPSKPYPTFPLFAHDSGQWAKKIKGKLHYFGKWEHPTAALLEYEKRRPDLEAGRKYRPPIEETGITVIELVDWCLAAKQHALDAEEMTQRHFDNMTKVGETICSVFGPGRIVETLKPADFIELREKLLTYRKDGKAYRRRAIAAKRLVATAKAFFNWGMKNDKIQRTVPFGDGFVGPPNKHARIERRERGSLLYQPDEYRILIAAAPQPLRSFILLGLNCGYGNADCGTMLREYWQGEWIDHHRHKTGVDRRAKLWPETVDSLRAAELLRPDCAGKHPELLFVTHSGNPWHEDRVYSPVTGSFTRLAERLGLKRRGVGFYSLRHTAQTIGERAGDLPALKMMMGHADHSISAAYREEIDDSRLEAVATAIHSWLFA